MILEYLAHTVFGSHMKDSLATADPVLYDE